MRRDLIDRWGLVVLVFASISGTIGCDRGPTVEEIERMEDETQLLGIALSDHEQDPGGERRLAAIGRLKEYDSLAQVARDYLYSSEPRGRVVERLVECGLLDRFLRDDSYFIENNERFRREESYAPISADPRFAYIWKGNVTTLISIIRSDPNEGLRVKAAEVLVCREDKRVGRMSSDNRRQVAHAKIMFLDPTIVEQYGRLKLAFENQSYDAQYTGESTLTVTDVRVRLLSEKKGVVFDKVYRGRSPQYEEEFSTRHERRKAEWSLYAIVEALVKPLDKETRRKLAKSPNRYLREESNAERHQND